MDGARETECFELALNLWTEERLACWECDTSCSVVEGVLVCHVRSAGRVREISLLCSLAHEVVEIDRCIALVFKSD